ncbi:MAG TPA: TIGR03546 family protein [Gemmatimonadaceae bacterium]|nr:TIGR03546 family protein [Gemmatimonadaceae bacterium]
MIAILKFLHSLAKTLHSDGTPGQIAGGIALGAALGLTPLMNLHNALVVVALCVINVSFGAGLLGMALFAPLGFMLDPIFDRIGLYLLTGVPSLRPLFTWIDGQPIIAFSNLTNTVVLGSLVSWVILFVPIFIAFRIAVIRYRVSIGEWFMRTRLYHALAATKIFDVYSWFRP